MANIIEDIDFRGGSFISKNGVSPTIVGSPKFVKTQKGMAVQNGDADELEYAITADGGVVVWYKLPTDLTFSFHYDRRSITVITVPSQ